MSKPLRLVIFDVDGTLVDSQGDILASMEAAFDAAGLAAPTREDVLDIVGLSLPQAMQRLAPEADNAALVQTYKDSYARLRVEKGATSSPLYPGAREALERLQAVPEMLLGVATGKSKRGLDGLIEAHGLQGMFVTRQVADFHPSKPHPSMIHQAMADAGVEADSAVMVGDTIYDMEMASAAGIPFLGVSWGYHAAERLSDARVVLDDFSQLDAACAAIWS